VLAVMGIGKGRSVKNNVDENYIHKVKQNQDK
jgi:hypothetical protein